MLCINIYAVHPYHNKTVHRVKSIKLNENAWAVTALLVSFLAQRRQMTSCRDVMTSHHNITSCHKTWQRESAQVNLSKTCFSIWQPWPMTLTIGLMRDVIKVNPYTRFWVPRSNSSAVRVLADGQTDWRDQFYTLNRWRGRELQG